MRKFFLIFFSIQLSSFAQSTSFDFHSPQNMKKFADLLYCDGDYLRAIEQYELIRKSFNNDTIDFKIMLGYSSLNLYDQAFDFYSIGNFSGFREEAQKIFIKNKFLIDSSMFQSDLQDNLFPFEMRNETANYFSKLRSLYLIATRSNEIYEEDLLDPFKSLQREKVEPFIEQSKNPDYKSTALAGIMSAIIPGSGKMYVGEWGDGIAGLLLTGLFAFLAYDNFKADHTTRGWVFTGVAAFFYGGNIYGSVAAAQIYNARIDFEFNNGLKLFLEQENYFLPEYDFCN